MKKGFPGTLLGLIVLLVFTTSCVGRLNDTAYLKYIASEESLFNKIIFEYPDTWSWVVYMDKPSTEIGMIYASNPDSEDPYGGFVAVSFDPFESQAEAFSAMETAVSKYLELRRAMRAEIISDQVFEIDGYSARKITTKLDSVIGIETGGHGPLVSEGIYILAENSYYTINFDILEDERYGKFGQGFDHMIETIQFLP